MFLSQSAGFVGAASVQPLAIMLLERLPDAAFLVDAHGSFTYGNLAAQQMLNCSNVELLAMKVPDLPLANLAQVWSERRLKAELGKVISFTDRYLTPDRELPVEAIVSCEQEGEQEYSCLLICPIESEPIVVKPKSILPSIPQLEPVFKFIEENYPRSIGLKDVAMATGYCPSYLTDLVRRCSGHTVNHWIIKCRIALACNLLQDTNDTVNQISEATGYQNEGHFFRQFRQHCGMTPLAWRKSQQQMG